MTSDFTSPCLVALALVLAACGGSEPAKVEPAKVEPAKVEPAKVEPAKVEPAKVEPAKVEPAPEASAVVVSPTGCKLSGEPAEQPCADLCKRIEDGALAGRTAVRVDAVGEPSPAQLVEVFDCLERAGIGKLAIDAKAP